MAMPPHPSPPKYAHARGYKYINVCTVVLASMSTCVYVYRYLNWSGCVFTDLVFINYKCLSIYVCVFILVNVIYNICLYVLKQLNETNLIFSELPLVTSYSLSRICYP